MAQICLTIVFFCIAITASAQSNLSPIETRVALQSQNLEEAKKEINSLLEDVNNSLKISANLDNVNVFRKTVSDFLDKSDLPLNDSLELKAYILELVQVGCGAKFVDLKERFEGQDNIATTTLNCWEAAARHLALTGRTDCTGNGVNTLTCYQNIFQDTLDMVNTELKVDKKIEQQKKKLFDDAQAEIARVSNSAHRAHSK
jgi:hypothetical protein